MKKNRFQDQITELASLFDGGALATAMGAEFFLDFLIEQIKSMQAELAADRIKAGRAAQHG